MPAPRQFLAAVLGLAAAAGCIRLGRWQLERLQFRRDLNGLVISRLSAPPRSPFGLPPSTRRWRRVIVVGTFDFDHQIVLTGRSLEGAPGVNVITPFAPDIPAAPILVNRGWVYAPDAQTVQLGKHDEPAHQTISGYADDFVFVGDGAARAASTPNAWRRLDGRELEHAFPYPIAPFYLVAQADSGGAPAPGAPVRLPLPSLDEGPHRGYAIQWFAFALIALGGASVVIYKERHQAAKTRTGKP